MVSERDIWTSANLMIKLHGDDATIQAAMRADALIDADDMEGRRVWLRIVTAVKKLQQQEVHKGASRH